MHINILIVVSNILIFILAFSCFINIYRKISGIQWLYIILLLFPTVLAIPGAVEERYFISLYLLVYIFITMMVDYKDIIKKWAERGIFTIVSVISVILVWSMVVVNLLSEPEHAQLGLDGSITYKENMVGFQTSSSTMAENGISAIRANYFGNNDAKISYRVHIRGKGWSDWVNDGLYAGETNKESLIDGIQFMMNSTENEQVKYRVLYNTREWSEWINVGEIAGALDGETYLQWIEVVLTEE